jgi:prolyl oligopeptidase
VIAHIRGGREFGTAWHEAARREGRRLAHDDFAAVAADLVRRRVRRPGRIAAAGASNGGLLIANMLTRYPERFGALFCAVPVTDMRRFAKLLIGPALIDEFGDPEDSQDWKFLAGLSAYHVAAPGKTYPPILMQRAAGMIALIPVMRKMAAKLQTMGYQAYFYEPATGGHALGNDHFTTQRSRHSPVASCAAPLAGNSDWSGFGTSLPCDAQPMRASLRKPTNGQRRC